MKVISFVLYEYMNFELHCSDYSISSQSEEREEREEVTSKIIIYFP